MSAVNELTTMRLKSIPGHNWIMVFCTVVFLTLYLLILFGWLRPMADFSVLARFEPLIFVFIGYYFGRVPSWEIERSLKEEVGRQTRKTDATQQAKEQVQLEREGLEERVKNARAVLLTLFADFSHIDKVPNGSDRKISLVSEMTKRSVETAMAILKS